MKWRSLEESAAETDLRPLREIFAERRELIEKYVPADALAVHMKVITELKAQAFEDRRLPIGATVPEFSLNNHQEKPVSSRDLLHRGPLVICFFRGRWDPFCCGQMEAMNFIYPHIKAAGAELIAISPQTVQQSFFMADQHSLRLQLLSDPHNQIARQFGLVYRVPHEQASLYRRTFVNLPHVNGDDSWELPIPATYLIDRQGIVRQSWADADYRERPEPVDILDALDNMNSRT